MATASPTRWVIIRPDARAPAQTGPYLFGPEVYDPFGAQLVMHHGFKAVYFSGYSFAISRLGTTDMGLQRTGSPMALVGRCPPCVSTN